jgi:8-oxo-dGTP diphosphatase
MAPEIRTFGERRPHLDYVERPGSYAILERAGELLVVSEASGWFLPGGGIEPGEDPIEALRREVREEAGLEIEEVRPLYVVGQYAVSAQDGVAYHKICRIFGARPLDERDGGALEARWVTPRRAVELLTYECFRWVVEHR